jgi:hypothetical protein
MAQPRIVEVDYYTFRAELKAAAAAGARIEKTDGDRWQEYVRTRQVNLYTIQAWAKVRFTGDDLKLAIIDAGGDWDGVYVWSEEDERAARWESGEAPAPELGAQDARAGAPEEPPHEGVAGEPPGADEATEPPTANPSGDDSGESVT